MFSMVLSNLVLLLFGTVSLGSPIAQSAESNNGSIAVSLLAPKVEIRHPRATIIGLPGDVEQFPGVPFAEPPIGLLRLRPPRRRTLPMGMFLAVKNGKACPQFVLSTDIRNGLDTISSALLLDSPLFQRTLHFGEDCLVLNIHRPAGTKKNAKLPVLFWIFGGAFELGWNAIYDGAVWVRESVKIGQPIIVVTINYRVGGFGFLGGKEVLADGAANLGLLDQRMALEWVSDNIGDFGGDPEKVTIWGESSGAISVYDQMLLYDGDNTYKGKKLFRGAIMNSGSVTPADPVDSEKPQRIFDQIARDAGCGLSLKKLECLRLLPYEILLNAMNKPPNVLGYHSIALSYLPRPDGKVLTQSPDQLGLQGKVAKVPFIIGDQEDEGTLFALFQKNITTKRQLVKYFKDLYFAHADESLLTRLVDLYDDIDKNGAPFRTGLLNNIYPQFKRLAAILGDITFTLPRRAVLTIGSALYPDTPSWSYLASYDYGTPILGTFHGSDIFQVFFGIKPNYAAAAFHSYYISFVNSLDPNAAGKFVKWPRYNISNPQLLWMHADSSAFITDDFRNEAYLTLLNNSTSFYF